MCCSSSMLLFLLRESQGSNFVVSVVLKSVVKLPRERSVDRCVKRLLLQNFSVPDGVRRHPFRNVRIEGP